MRCQHTQTTRARNEARRPRGMTLLEVMLALTLTAFVLAAISMAIDLNLRMLDKHRNDVERIQVARAVLQMIASDLRSTVQPSEVDFSSLATMAAAAAASGALPPELGGDAADSSGSSESSSSGASGDSASGSSGGGSGGSPGGLPGGLPGGMTPGDLEDALDDVLGGGTGGGSGGATNSGASAPGGSDAGSTDPGVGDSGDLGDTSTTENTDIAASDAPPPVPGLYGNQYELQIDVGRLPRVDEMQRMVAASSMGQIQDIPSDVKTVAYFLYNPTSGTGVGDYRDAAGNPQAGLVRRVLDRAVTLYASDNASSSSLQSAGEVVAPEVGMLQFEYFDGMQWLYEWDSQELGSLPMAVRITIVMNPHSAAQMTSSRVPTPTSQVGTDMTGETYSLTVRLPTARPAETTTTDPSGMEAVGL